MANEMNKEIAGERALREGEVDRLGFKEVAERIANSIVDRASTDGLVIGLEGEWGSGKSSLLYLIERSLDQLSDDKCPTIINFRPWLVGNRDALLASLFSELADKIARVHLARGDATSLTIVKAKKTAEAVRKFARALSKTGELVETAGALWKPLELAGKALRSLGAMSKKKDDPADLAGLKAEIVKDLRDLNRRFIITVDDVDRLEPPEVIEVLRLIRSVADFPNVIYLLCYDAKRLEEAIESGGKIGDGATYLEKIVQLTVMIPKPEPFELRHWFEEEVVRLLGSVSSEVRERLKVVIDQEGARQLRTPRSVVRTLDSLRFFWPAVREEKIDAADLVWLQLIKDGAPKLYRWVEAYVASVAATSFGTATETESSQADRLEALLAALDRARLKDSAYGYMFAELLPGIEVSFDEEGPPVTIQREVRAQRRQAAIEGRRLASPDHYRLYFSLIGPTHAITQAGFDDFWAAVDASPTNAAQILLNLHRQIVPGSLRKSDVLFERLRDGKLVAWTASRAGNLLLALAEVMDEIYRLEPSKNDFITTSWDRAERLVPILYAKLTEAERPVVNREFFENGRAIGWLTSLLRHETFAHGLFGNRAKSPEDWFLPEYEFSHACSLMLDRYRNAVHPEFLKPVPGPDRRCGHSYGSRRYASHLNSIGRKPSHGPLREHRSRPALHADLSDRGAGRQWPLLGQGRGCGAALGQHAQGRDHDLRAGHGAGRAHRPVEEADHHRRASGGDHQRHLPVHVAGHGVFAARRDREHDHHQRQRQHAAGADGGGRRGPGHRLGEGHRHGRDAAEGPGAEPGAGLGSRAGGGGRHLPRRSGAAAASHREGHDGRGRGEGAGRDAGGLRQGPRDHELAAAAGR
jgi:hypothetical protein